jgi:hypothetical protein
MLSHYTIRSGGQRTVLYRSMLTMHIVGPNCATLAACLSLLCVLVRGIVVRRLVLLVGNRPSILMEDKAGTHTFRTRTEEKRSMAVSVAG